MTRNEALEILKLYRNWNTSQTSVDLAFNGKRTQEDDLLDARRQLIIDAYAVLRSSNEQ